MKKSMFALIAVAVIFFLASCAGKTDVVESGTYQGTITEVEADKTEIYVKTEDGKKLELYFTDETQLTRNNQQVEFTALKEGQKVEVKLVKVGKRLDPLSVNILE